MTASFEPEATLDRYGVDYRTQIDRMPNHPKDRHVLAAAVAVEAHYLVTENRKDFQLAGTPFQGVAVVSADQFLVALLATSRWHQLNVQSALHRQVHDSRSLFTLDALVEQLVHHNGTARFAARIHALQEEFSDWPAELITAIENGERISEQQSLDSGLSQ